MLLFVRHGYHPDRTAMNGRALRVAGWPLARLQSGERE